MFSSPLVAAGCTARRVASQASSLHAARTFATAASTNAVVRDHKIVVIGAGTAGLAIIHQLLRKGGFAQNDIAVVDPEQWAHYQPGWTLVGGGLKTKEELQKPLRGLIDPKLRFYNEAVSTFSPERNIVTLRSGEQIGYEHLVVVPGFETRYDSIKGLPEALSNPDAPVSSIYGYETCHKVFPTIQSLQKGSAIFTQPSGIIKCAGAPQKIMWLALDHWRRAGRYDAANPAKSPIRIAFATGLPTMFGVPKYSATLEKLRVERSVEGLFQHDLVAVNGNTATFAVPNSKEHVTRKFDFLHAVPKMAPHDFVKDSPLANEAGYVDVCSETTRHVKFDNVWSVGDASSLPTSKTMAAITSQVPVMVRNMMHAMEGREAASKYTGYTSCPLTTEYGKVLLAEFKYGGVPKETFGTWLGMDQGVPRRSFYYMKKHFFPWVYFNSMVKGTWPGPSEWTK